MIKEQIGISNPLRIAYLITAYHNFEHLKRLLSSLNDSGVWFFIHIDKKAPFPLDFFGYPNIKLIKRYKVWWGGWSHQKVIFELMSVAVKQEFDYYALISGSDYPIRKNEHLYSILKKGGEFISIKEGFPSEMKKKWIENFYFDLFYRRKPNKPIWIKILLRIEKKISRCFPKSKYPFKKVFYGPTWWVLSHATVKYVLDFVKSNPAYIRFFKYSFCCEEILIPTIIGNSSIQNLKGNLTYVDWSVHPGPAFINENHLAKFKNIKLENEYGDNEVFFARKFSDESVDLIEYIETNIRR